MFSRLLKHEWRANSGLFGILTLAALGIGILATAVLRVLIHSAEKLMFTQDVWGTLALVAMGMFLFFSILALIVYVIAVQFILLYRFYKNKFTDEGYLTFTLPVKTTHIFWSSFLNMLLWLAIAGTVVAVIVFLAVLFGTAKHSLVNLDVFEGIREALRLLFGWDWRELFSDKLSIPYMVILGLTGLLAPFYGLFVPMACITAGAVLAKKHKILASFGVYYVVNFAVGILTSVLSVLPSILVVHSGDAEAAYLISSAIQLVITLALTVGAYFFTIHVMQRRLNLP